MTLRPSSPRREPEPELAFRRLADVPIHVSARASDALRAHGLAPCL